MTKAIEDFFAAWTNPDAAAREALISGAMTDGAVYADPRTEAPMTGAAALAEYTGMFASMGMPVAVEHIHHPVPRARHVAIRRRRTIPDGPALR